jgi:hypothetical protein
MEAFQKIVAFLVGAFLVLIAVLDECPRAAVIGVGLVLMGVFSVNEGLSIIRGTSRQRGTKDD